MNTLLEAIAQLKDADGKTDPRKVESLLMDNTDNAAGVGDIELMQIVRSARDLGLTALWLKYWQDAVNRIARNREREQREQERKQAKLDQEQERIRKKTERELGMAEARARLSEAKDEPLYKVIGGQIVYVSPRSVAGDVLYLAEPVANFDARIVEESITEDGEILFAIKGRGIRGGPFTVDIPAADYADERKLKGKLEGAAGAYDPIFAGMAKHIGPAIKLLTNGQIRRIHHYNRTGWAGDKFLIPGLNCDDVHIHLEGLPFKITPDAELELGLKALQALIESIGPELTTVVLSALLQAPLSKKAGWDNERYAPFVTGLSGSLKTSFCQAAMCIYGPGSMSDQTLIKWGNGATQNAIMSIAAQAADMPLLIDNYKPITGGGGREFISLIHNILEGGEKKRLSRNAELRPHKPVSCFPLVTGEDVPSTDPASLARVLVIPFPAATDEAKEKLATSQELYQHLCSIGKAWLEWLQSEEIGDVIQRANASMDSVRETYLKTMLDLHTDMVNPLRIAANLATNHLTWKIASEHPRLGYLIRQFADSHNEGLLSTAKSMAAYTASAMEASRFLSILGQLIQSGRVSIATRGSALDTDPQRRGIGWIGDDGSYYLLPELVREAVSRITPDALGGLSAQALHTQLDRLNAIASHSSEGYTKVIEENGKSVRTLHLKAEALNR